MVQLGKKHTLRIVDTVDFGVYLDAEELGKVLLPRKYIPSGVGMNDKVSVFLYLDSEDRPIATTRMPTAMVGEFAYLEVVDVNDVGAFLDWGLEKDLLVPYSEQHRPMEAGRSYLVYLSLDKVQGRIVASSKIDKYLDDERPHDFRAGQAVDLIIANSTDLGFKAIVNHSHWGMLYGTEVFQRLSFGQSVQGFIKHVRPDGKLDLSLQSGRDALDKHAETIRQYLQNHAGYAPLHDKTDPEVIADVLGMSKAAFKKSIGRLYKLKIIDIEKDGIRLLSE
jgi:predicted RNA-binding protein (virulence factor B family)